MKEQELSAELVALDEAELESVAGGCFLLRRLFHRAHKHCGSGGGYSKPDSSSSCDAPSSYDAPPSYDAPSKIAIPSSYY